AGARVWSRDFGLSGGIMEKWVVTDKRADFQRIAEKFGIDPVIARLLRNRDVVEMEDIRTYRYGTLEDLHSPWLLRDMDTAVVILSEYIARRSRVRIIGDYDIDGVSATYILLKCMKRLVADVDTYFPDRVKDGYGIPRQLIEQAKEDHVDTIVTCDNGISAADEKIGRAHV